ncbi:MAG TPA: heme-binding domain-containing protein [Planctomycetota bacterium]|nr:heme-binding domain-containing protein [Planctomycetota bacterium]
MKRWLKRIGYALLALLVLIQLVPYGRDHSAPPGDTEPKWDSPRTRELAVQAGCFDCHSNHTHWPWYSWVAPMSWLVAQDVEDGREQLNFSQFDKRQRNADECADQVRSGEMPLWQYKLAHAGARLSDAEREELAAGLEATFEDN